MRDFSNLVIENIYSKTLIQIVFSQEYVSNNIESGKRKSNEFARCNIFLKKGEANLSAGPPEVQKYILSK